MNQIYKVIWSRVKHCYVVVSEVAGRCGKMEEQLLKGEPAHPRVSVRPCSYRMPDAGGGGSEYTVWSGCFRYRR